MLGIDDISSIKSIEWDRQVYQGFENVKIYASAQEVPQAVGEFDGLIRIPTRVPIVSSSSLAINPHSEESDSVWSMLSCTDNSLSPPLVHDVPKLHVITDHQEADTRLILRSAHAASLGYRRHAVSQGYRRHAASLGYSPHPTSPSYSSVIHSSHTDVAIIGLETVATVPENVIWFTTGAANSREILNL